MRIALLFALFATLPMTCLAQGPAGVDLSAAARESEPAAKESLSTLAALSKEGDSAARMGFAEPSDAEKTELSTPLSDFIVGLDGLKSWKAGMDAKSLLRSTDMIVYPVRTTTGGVRSSVSLKKEDDTWRPVAFGAPGLTSALVQTRGRVVEDTGLPTSDLFEVRIPSMNLVFVSYLADGRLMLAPVVDDQRFGLSAGVVVPADKLFTTLQPVAERDNGLPR